VTQTHTPTQADPARMLVALGRHWGWTLAYGILTLAAGLAALAWPGVTLLAIAVVFGLQLIVAGIFRFVSAFATHPNEPGGTRVLMALIGIFSLIVGLYAIRHVLLTIVALALLLGILWVVAGSVELFAALSHPGMRERDWTIFISILSVIAGIILLVYPGISVVTLAVLAGVWLLVFGLMEITLAFRLRAAIRAEAE
jgi:uncharacterized membrane protein HdeD (DUF308 family)